MIVKNLFDKIDFETLWNYFYETKLKEDDDTPEQIENSKLCHQLAYLRIKQLEPVKNTNNILVFHKYVDDLGDEEEDYIYDDVSLFYIDEIKKEFVIDDRFENNFDFSNLNVEELRKQLFKHNSCIPSYAFEFTKWNEILGFNIHEKSLNKIGELSALSSVFYEMTFCGFEEDDIQEELSEIKSRAEEILDMKGEYNFSEAKSITELFPDWEKYKPTEEEDRRSYLRTLRNKKEIYFILKDIFEAI